MPTKFRLQGGEALLRGQRRVANFPRIAEQRRADGATKINVNAAPFAVAVRLREAGNAGIDAAAKEPLFQGGIRRRTAMRMRRTE